MHGVIALYSSPVFATHEADHRYIISGQVRDASGNPQKEVLVSLEHKGGEKKDVKTDHLGRYEVLFHLHNENLGEKIIVSYGDIQRKITITFDPEDKFTNRGDVVDFGAPSNEPTLPWGIVGMGSLLGSFVLLYFFKKSKKSKGRSKKQSSTKKKRKKV